MKQPYRVALYASLALVLCSCASSDGYQSSVYLNGMTAPSMDLTNPRFYMNESEGAPILSRPDLFRPADAH